MSEFTDEELLAELETGDWFGLDPYDRNMELSVKAIDTCMKCPFREQLRCTRYGPEDNRIPISIMVLARNQSMVCPEGKWTA
jgi:hypothetical protein